MFTGSIFDQTLSQDREGGSKWGGGGRGPRRGRGRARGTLDPGEDSADELEDGDDAEDGNRQGKAEAGSEEPLTDGQSRRFLYLKVRHSSILFAWLQPPSYASRLCSGGLYW